jgi:YegS/Rv2252/BmrU family lipid kinase
MNTAAIVNPASASGRTARAWSGFSAQLGPVETRFTHAPGHATELARGLLTLGFDRIIAVGGDGTVNEVVNGFLDNDRLVHPGAELAVLPFGTGGDLKRTLGLRDAEEAVRLLRSGLPGRETDVGKIRYHTHRGGPETRYFLNLISFGMGGEVAANAKNLFKALGGRVAFLYSTFNAFLSYRPKTVSLRIDGADAGSHRIMNIAIGNGRYHGGGMHVCPRAALNDGLLDVTIIDALSMFELVRDVRVLYSDDVYRHPKVHHQRGTRVEASSPDRVSIEVDGESVGVLPAEIGVLPIGLRVLRTPSPPE